MRAHTAGLKKEIGILLPACPGSDEQLSMSHWTSLSGLEKKKRCQQIFACCSGKHPSIFSCPGPSWQTTWLCLSQGRKIIRYLFILVLDDQMALFYALSIWGKNVQLYKIRFYCSVLQLSSSVDSDSFFGPREFKKADTRRQVSKT